MAVQRAGEAGVEVEELGREAFESVMLRDHPSGLGAIARIVERPLTDLAAKEGDVYVGLLDVGNPGNLGSIIRSVDAAGGAGVIIVGDSTDPYHPQSVKASMGTMFSVPIRRTRDLEDLFAWTLMERVGVVATSAKAKLGFWDAAIPTPALFLFGSEAAGLPVEVLERAGLTVTLPMAGTASSLNLSVAVGVFLYEMRRRIAIPSSKSTVTVHLEEGS